tara:strand:- start:44 stop:193 length:150 start_codon:yes stop_codon:yes gene_type:complete
MKAKLIKFCYAAVEEKMLKIYATVMTTIFFAVWIPAMVAVVKEIIRTFF